MEPGVHHHEDRREDRPSPGAFLDLRGTPCPLNYIRSRLALEALPPGGWLRVALDQGEPLLMVAEGMRSEGHRVEKESIDPDPDDSDICARGVFLWIRRGGG
jgi:TusA-related sulfurtransferase